jgi:hypothetical protein
MNNWLYKGAEITSIDQLPEDCVGFVYVITNSANGKIYVGKKILRNKLSKLLTKKEKAEWNKPGRIPKKKKETKESNWKDYYGSSKPLLEDLKRLGEETFTREMLKLCYTKKSLTYWETYYQMVLEVLANDTYNENICGRFYRRDLVDPQDSPELSGGEID